MYVLVRTDLTIPQQVVQAAHAAHESGGKFGAPAGCFLIILSVPDEPMLHAWADRLGDSAVLFTEPDLGGAATALATAPFPGKQSLFSRLKLWSPS